MLLLGRSRDNNNRATINILHQSDRHAFKNIAKGFSFPAQDPTTVSSDGYPLSTPASVIGSNPSMPLGYYGEFVWKWTGQGSMQILSAPPMIVSSGGTDIGLAGSSGDITGGSNVTASGKTNPRIVFAFGWNIQAISDNGSGLIRITTKSGYVSSSSYTSTVVNIAGANANTGANGTWTITKVDGQNFDLVGSTFSNAQGSAGGTAVFGATNLAIRFLNSGTFSGMGGLVWCRSADEASVDAGQLISDDLIGQLQTLMNDGGSSLASRGWLRFMDVTGVQGSFECDFSQRVPSSYVTYVASGSLFFRPGYWAGTITNGGSDDYTCSDPSVSVWNGSSYIDNAIVQGLPTATNTNGTPTLAVGGHAAKPILNMKDSSSSIDAGIPLILGLTAGAPTPATDVLQYTFSATWLNGGTPVVHNYTTVSGDGTLTTLTARLQASLAANTTLRNAGIQFQNPPAANSFGPFVTYPSAQAGRLSISYTSGPAISEIWNCKKSQVPTTGTTFIFNYLLDGWLMQREGMISSIPFEAIVEMCNRVGAHCWFNWGMTKPQWITDVAKFFGDNTTGLTSGLRFGGEAWNEVWNAGATPYQFLQNIGCTLGWSLTSHNPNYSFTALRTIQYSALSKAAWIGKGRNASDHYTFTMGPTFDTTISGSFDDAMLSGNFLTDVLGGYYSSYGGLGGGSTPAYTAAGSRPVDITTAIGIAPYWGSPWWNTTASNITGAMSNHTPWLQASLDYANGNTATAFASLTNQFNGTTTRVSGTSGAITLASYQSGAFTNEEALAASYDSYRTGAGLPKLGILHYEGGPQWAVGDNGVNGTNSVTDTTPLTNQITSLISGSSWDVSPYTVSGTNSASEIANQVVKLMMGWKYDTDVNGGAAGTGSYKRLIKDSYYQALKTISGSNRETKPAQYGYYASTWAFYPVDFNLANPYQNFDAMSEWNAG